MDRYTILLLFQALPSWLQLTREQRGEFFEKRISPVFGKYASSCHAKLFDSEYFHGAVSDFVIVDVENLRGYRFLMEELRDTEIYTVPYFAVKDIIIGKENGFTEFEASIKTT